MSDRQSKNYDEATKVFPLQVDERRRSKRGAYYETIAEPQGISSSSQNVEATKASHGLGISAPIAHRKRKTTLGKLQGYASSSKNVVETGLDGLSVPHDCQRPKTRRRLKSKPTQRGNKNADMDLEEVEIERIDVAGFRAAALLNKNGNKNGDMDLEEIEIERIDEAEFKRSKNRDMDLEEIEIERIDEAEFKSKRTLSTSTIRLSTRKGFDDGFSAAKSLKNVHLSRKISSSADLYRCFSPEDAGHGSGQEHLVQKGNETEDMVCKKTEIDKTSRVELGTKKIHSKSKIGTSTRQGINEDHFVATSRKKTGGAIENIFSAGHCRSFPPEHAALHSYQGRPDKSCSIIQKGNDNDDMELEENEIQINQGADFIYQKTHLVSNMGPSTKEELDEGYSAATSKKDVGSVGSRMLSADCRKFSCPEDAFHDSNQAWPHKSSSFIQIGSDRDDMVPELEIKKIGEAEFRSQKTHSESMMGPSLVQELSEGESHSATNSRKNVYGVRKDICPSDLCIPFSSEECNNDSDPLLDKSTPSVKKGGKRGCTSSKEIKIEGIDEADLNNKISSLAPYAALSAVKFQKNADMVIEISSDSGSGSFSSEDAGGDSDMEQTDESSSFAEKGNNDKDVDPNESGIEKIDESEFRNYMTHVVSRVRSSTAQALNDGHFAATSRDNVKSTSKKISTEKIDEKRTKIEVSAYSTRKENDEDRNRNLDDDVKNCSVEFISAYSSSQSNSDSVDAFLQDDDEISSCGAYYDLNLCIASRTRSKMGIVRKHVKVDIVPLNGRIYSSDDDDSEGDSSSNSDELGLLCLCDKACKVQNNLLMEVSAENREACSKQEESAVKYASDGRHFSDLQNEETNCNEHTVRGQEFSLRTRKYDVSSKQTNRGKAHRRCEANKEKKEITRILSDDANAAGGINRTLSDDANAAEGINRILSDDANTAEGINRILSDDANAAEVSKECCNGKRENLQVCTYSKQSYPEKGCNKVEKADGLQPKGQPQARVRKQRKAVSPTHSKDFDHSSDDKIQEKSETISDFHCGKYEKVHVADQIKMTKREQIFPKHYDFCRMLVDSVLERGPVLEMKENNDEPKEEPAAQTQSTLPTKFRFEDEVPKEVEKTEYQKEMEGLFAELDFNWALEELGTFTYPELDKENAKDRTEETQHARCTRGKHELVLQEDQGLICIYCRHLELGPRDILPEWVEKTCTESERKRYPETEQHLEFDGFHLQSSKDTVANFNNSANGTVWSIKPGIRESMYEHQQEGFEFLWKNLAGSINLDELKSTEPDGVGGCIISHAPGTGKTRLTIVFLESYLRLFPNCRPMIITPASMLLTWEEEFRKWNVDFPFHNLNNLEFSGKENKTALGLLAGAKRGNKDAARMVKIYSWNMGRSILGISYSLFEKLTGEKYLEEKTSEMRERIIIDGKTKALRKILLEKPGLVILDEGHTPRNRRSNIWNVLLKVQTEKRVILSGTPFQNNFGELFNTLHIVRPAIADVLAQEKTFAEMIASRRKSSKRKYKEEKSQSTLIPEAIDRAVEKLKISMSPFVHVHKGTILQESLPGLRDCVILLKPPALQKSLIERLEGSPNTFHFEHKVALISVHPYLFQHSDSTEEERIGIDLEAVQASKLNPNEGVKTKFILEFVHLSVALNEKVLIFSQYIQPLELIKEQLKEIFKWVVGKQILRMQGKLEQKQRQMLINVFNDPQSESKVMLASTRCCSEGISLVGASRVILLDVVWNPSVERQAICRAYRIGQKKFVYTYHLMTLGTSEADKYCRQAEKDRLSELVFTSSSNESNKQKHPSLGIEDRILEEMVGHAKLKQMFEKIINQPKDADLIQTFGHTT
ncbi:SNF2 domain-containing protein CLASSY 3 [Sesamum alatum]|uniref:SNF2 domain-containing protein CLASSY 3 n=1 Tax=Sesamum alatum TaxID=300844 RepID=A0AAE1XLW8_9LAMI|nr:SNF2 domain-containing protein CLASSY 3 [Sesamum alatum]